MKRLAQVGAMIVAVGLAASCDGSLSSSPAGGGLDAGCSAGRCLVILASGQLQPGDVAVNPSGVYWTNQGSYVGNNSGSVMSVPLGGGALTTVASGQSPYGIAVDGTSVYWTEFANLPDGGVLGAVKKASLGGGAPTVFASGSTGCLGIAVNAKVVSWGNWCPAPS